MHRRVNCGVLSMENTDELILRCGVKNGLEWFKTCNLLINRLRDLTKSKTCPQNSFCQWGCFSSTYILNKLYFLIYFLCSYQHYATFSQFLFPLTIKCLVKFLAVTDFIVHSSAYPVCHMILWPREGQWLESLDNWAFEFKYLCCSFIH